MLLMLSEKDWNFDPILRKFVLGQITDVSDFTIKVKDVIFHVLAGQLAAQHLPPSGCVVGRPGNPRSHWFYRVEGELVNKPFRYKSGGKWCSVIDILSDGKQVVVGPSVHPSGDIYDDLVGEPAIVTAAELMAAVQALFDAVMAIVVASGEIVDEGRPTPKASATVPPTPQRAAASSQWAVRPGDDYNARADIRALLIRHGWTQVKEGDNEHWRRPGKTEGTSATLRSAREFYNFSLTNHFLYCLHFQY